MSEPLTATDLAALRLALADGAKFVTINRQMAVGLLEEIERLKAAVRVGAAAMMPNNLYAPDLRFANHASFDAGFRAGLEAAAKLVEHDASSSHASLKQRLAAAIRELVKGIKELIKGE